MLIIIVLTNALFSLDDLIRTGAEFFFVFLSANYEHWGVCGALCGYVCRGTYVRVSAPHRAGILNLNTIELLH